MDNYCDILRYMGHNGKVEKQLETLISSCLEKLAAVLDQRHVIMQLPCTVTDDNVTIDTMKIKSKALAARLNSCTQAYLFAATLGADVDRLIAQRAKMDSAEALCVQAFASVQIEDYCDSIEKELINGAKQQGMQLSPRFSPGYCDFDIAHQTDLLRLLEAHKRIGVSETKSHMLTPLKSVTAIIGRRAGEI